MARPRSKRQTALLFTHSWREVLMQCEMQTASPRIWPWVAVFSSYDGLYIYIYIYEIPIASTLVNVNRCQGYFGALVKYTVHEDASNILIAQSFHLLTSFVLTNSFNASRIWQLLESHFFIFTHWRPEKWRILINHSNRINDWFKLKLLAEVSSLDDCAELQNISIVVWQKMCHSVSF